MSLLVFIFISIFYFLLPSPFFMLNPPMSHTASLCRKFYFTICPTFQTNPPRYSIYYFIIYFLNNLCPEKGFILYFYLIFSSKINSQKCRVIDDFMLFSLSTQALYFCYDFMSSLGYLLVLMYLLFSLMLLSDFYNEIAVS